MSKFVKGRLVGLSTVLLLVLVTLPAANGQAQHSPKPHTPARLVRAAEKIFQDGAHAKLPPHISTLLGLSKEEETR